jgi:predicted DNA-binding antitoxin AbrB/MazE fold protein
MHQLLDAVYHNGHIDIDKPIPLKDNTKIKVYIITDNDEKQSSDFGVYEFSKDLDKVNIRDFAHED